MNSKTDHCEWCGKRTSSIQISSGTNVCLCPKCCPDIDNPSSVPENAPYQWYFMDEQEKRDWKNGMNIEEIKEEHNWMNR